jgi:hypothetical protein
MRRPEFRTLQVRVSAPLPLPERTTGLGGLSPPVFGGPLRVDLSQPIVISRTAGSGAIEAFGRVGPSAY